jgi:hypothetical protein
MQTHQETKPSIEALPWNFEMKILLLKSVNYIEIWSKSDKAMMALYLTSYRRRSCYMRDKMKEENKAREADVAVNNLNISWNTWHCIMTKVLLEILIYLSIYFCLTCLQVMLSALGRWHHTQENWTTAKTVHLTLKTGYKKARNM